MQKDNSVIFKGGKDGIVIILDDDADYVQIADSLREKIRSSSRFFADAATTIAFKGKQLEEEELDSLIEIINTETDMSITFVEDLTGATDAARGKGVERKQRTLDELVTDGTYFHRGGLRNGQAISHSGSVVVMGDINAGAEVVAAGNVVVFGAIRGLVHAGATGDAGAFAAALSMQPIQLRIADKITYFPKEVMKENRNRIDPVYAFVKGDEIYIASITS